MPEITLGGRRVAPGEPVFVVAEVGINHGGDPAQAEALVRAAAAAGADAVKFQTYRTEARVPADSPYFGLLKRCELPFARQAEMKRLAESLGLLFFSTPFDSECVDFLDAIGVPAFKLASFDIVNGALTRRVLAKGRPVIASTGMADRVEVDAFVEAANRGRVPFALLHCVSAYPTPPHEANLRVIGRLRELYGVPTGYSDHTLGVETPVLAAAAGALIIEKHFTLDRAAEGPDHALSADPAQLAELVRRVREVELALGRDDLECRAVEKPSLQFRRPS